MDEERENPGGTSRQKSGMIVQDYIVIVVSLSEAKNRSHCHVTHFCECGVPCQHTLHRTNVFRPFSLHLVSQDSELAHSLLERLGRIPREHILFERELSCSIFDWGWSMVFWIASVILMVIKNAAGWPASFYRAVAVNVLSFDVYVARRIFFKMNENQNLWNPIVDHDEEGLNIGDVGLGITSY